MKRYCLALDLKDDSKLIDAYIAYHQQVWPEILDSIKASGIVAMEIYQVHTRLFMLMEVDDHFSFEKKQRLDSENQSVGAWEALMDAYQQRLPFAAPNEKWVLMHKIFEL